MVCAGEGANKADRTETNAQPPTGETYYAIRDTKTTSSRITGLVGRFSGVYFHGFRFPGFSRKILAFLLVCRRPCCVLWHDDGKAQKSRSSKRFELGFPPPGLMSTANGCPIQRQKALAPSVLGREVHQYPCPSWAAQGSLVVCPKTSSHWGELWWRTPPIKGKRRC